MKKVTLVNSYHGTQVTILSAEGHPGSAYLALRMQAWAYPEDKAAKAKLHRVWKKLCGAQSCTCGIVRP